MQFGDTLTNQRIPQLIYNSRHQAHIREGLHEESSWLSPESDATLECAQLSHEGHASHPLPEVCSSAHGTGEEGTVPEDRRSGTVPTGTVKWDGV